MYKYFHETLNLQSLGGQEIKEYVWQSGKLGDVYLKNLLYASLYKPDLFYFSTF